MYFGFFAPPVAAAPPSAINVWAFKANGVENAGYVSIGPSSNSGIESHSKTNLVNQLFGDFSHTWMAWGANFDPEWVDHPIYDPGNIA